MKKIVYVDMDNVLVDFAGAIPKLSAEVQVEYEDRLDEVPGIFAMMEPMPDALASYRELTEHFDTYILSTAPWENPSAWTDKLLWVKEHLGREAYKRLTLSHNKHLNAGDYLIDDRPNNGAEHFRGEWLHFGKERFPDWPAVMAYLRGRIG